ncbi:MAG TPA: preprotein translocase subunit SecG [Gammaproteobacteria bacterium]|nr:preprotein translocase subunit SecG [Gammaproteobacteria bacterium]
MFSFLLVIQVLVSVSIIALVMLQHGKGADMGAAFGSGSSGTVFGARGSGSFLTRTTAILAAVFFINCVLIASPLLRDSERSVTGVADQLEQQVQQEQQKMQMEQAAESGDLPDVPPAETLEAVVEETTAVETGQPAAEAGLPEVEVVEEAPPADDLPQ